MSGRAGGRTTVDHAFPAPQRGGAVVPSAGRFVARARSRRRKAIAGWAAAVLLGVAAGWALLASPWGTVQAVDVSGTRRIDAAEVDALVAGEVGRPLLLVDTEALAGRVEALRLVADARVVRHWPGGLRVEVAERHPVAALPATGGGFRLVDRDGVEVEVVRAAPKTVPVVEVNLVTAGAPAVRSALDSLAVMPAGLRGEVRRIGAASGDGVWFALADGDKVVWGDAGESSLKAAALDALRRQSARERKAMTAKGNHAAARRPVTFDVSAPRAPSVQR